MSLTACFLLLQLINSAACLTDLLNRNTDARLEQSFVCGKVKHRSDILASYDSDMRQSVPLISALASERGYKIYGGQVVAEEGTYPWSARITVGTSVCSGVLISTSFVLTAAHCVVKDSRILPMTRENLLEPDAITVYLGSNDRDKGMPFPVAAYSVFNRQNWSDNDIALLMLDKSTKTMNMTRIQSVCIPTEHPQNLHEVMAIGWGHTYTDDTSRYHSLPQMLHEAMLSKVSCKGRYDQTHFCVSAQLKSVCKGDSGGATLVLRDNVWYVVGLTSFRVEGHCANQDRTWQTDVVKYNTWVVRSMKELKDAVQQNQKSPVLQRTSKLEKPRPMVERGRSRSRYYDVPLLYRLLFGL